MAQSARSLLYPTIWAAILSAIGTILLAVTIGVSVYQTLLTRRTVEAFQRAERAWLFNSNGVNSINFLHRQTGRLEFVTFTICWSNTGNSPATSVDMFYGRELVAAGQPVPEKFKLIPAIEPTTATVGPGVAFYTGRIAVDPEELRDVARRTKRLFLWAYVTYKTVFDDTIRESAVCVEVECGAGPENITDAGVPQGLLNYKPTGKHNYAT